MESEAKTASEEVDLRRNAAQVIYDFDNNAEINGISFLNKTKFTNLQVPLFFKDERKCLKYIGGETCLIKNLKEETTTGVALLLRPEAPHCKPIQGERKVTCNLLARVDVNEKNAKRVKCVNLGIVNRTYSFKKLSDFVYLCPNDPKLAINATNYDPTGLDFSLEREKEEDPLLIKLDSIDINVLPRNFTYRELPIDFNKVTNLASTFSTAALATNDPTVITAPPQSAPCDSFIGWNDPVPLIPQESLPLGEDSEVRKLIEIIAPLFEKQEMWLRDELSEKVPPNLQAKLRYALPHVSYAFRAGPFRLLRIKFGIDPRLRPDWRNQQILDIRIKKELLKKADFTERMKNTTVFGYPVRGIMIMQLKDLCLKSKEIDSMISLMPPYVDGGCTEDSGFFTKNELKSVRNYVLRATYAKFDLFPVVRGEELSGNESPLKKKRKRKENREKSVPNENEEEKEAIVSTSAPPLVTKSVPNAIVREDRYEIVDEESSDEEGDEYDDL